MKGETWKFNEVEEYMNGRNNTSRAYGSGTKLEGDFRRDGIHCRKSQESHSDRREERESGGVEDPLPKGKVQSILDQSAPQKGLTAP